MRKLLLLIMLSQLSFAAELSFVLSKPEIQNLAQVYPDLKAAKVFPELLKKLNVQVNAVFHEQTGELILQGTEESLKIAEYIYIVWLRSPPEVTLKFTHFEGTLDKRLIKHSFEKKLHCNQANAFQYSNKLLEKVGNNINGFSFNFEPEWDPFQKNIELYVNLSYKNEDLKIGDKGEQVLDLRTTLVLSSEEEVVLKLVDSEEMGWGSHSYVSIKLHYDLNSKYFTGSLPQSLAVSNTLNLRTIRISSNSLSFFKNPVNTLKSLGVAFPKGATAILNKNKYSLLILNTKENHELFDIVGKRKPHVFHSNTKCDITIYESNLIIKDTDYLEGHTLKKISQFFSICSKSHSFLLSKKFTGDYESSVYINFVVPNVGNNFKYDLIIKTPGPKSRARDYKLEGNFAGNKKYKVHLDEYHFMEIEVQK